MDYSKWDALVDTDDDEGPEDLTPAAEFGVKLLSSWLLEGTPTLSKAELQRVINFVEVQQARLGDNDNRARAPEIIDFLEQHPAPSVEPLLEATWLGRLHDPGDLDCSSRGPTIRIQASMTSALNTLAACRQLGARALFDEIWANPAGSVARKYLALGFAQELYEKRATVELQAAAKARPGGHPVETKAASLAGRLGVNRLGMTVALAITLIAVAISRLL